MSIRIAIIMLAAFFVGACVRVGHIQQQAPYRSANFSGDHKTVAQCVQRRLGGRVQDEGFGEKYVIADSAKNRADFTHWSVTVARTGNREGRAEWRVVRPPASVGPTTGGGITGALTPPGGGKASSDASGEIPDATVREYWNPVLDCIAQAKPGS